MKRGNLMDKNSLFRKLPKVDEVIMRSEIIDLIDKYSRKLVLESIREVIENYRNIILDLSDSDGYDFTQAEVIGSIIENVEKSSISSYKRVINCTGTVLHTNLGRAPLNEDIFEKIKLMVTRYSNLEYDIKNGKRGHRYDHLQDIIKKITGGEDVLVVNNNAAAVLLVLSTISSGKEAIVSRGELVEIGGSFRVPEVMEMSGTKLIEVGTTNKTHIWDYENKIYEDTGLLMKVHTSNYRIVGFHESVDIEELAKLGMKYDIPVYEDVGSGNFIDLSEYGIGYEPTIVESLKKGADIISFSGDKLLGGVQAGIIVGKKKYIEKMKKNQLLRALRPDKITIGILEELFRVYYYKNPVKDVMSVSMILETKDRIREKCERLMDRICGINGVKCELEKDFSEVGGGSLPMEKLDSYVVSIKHKKYSPASIEKHLRTNSLIPIIARIKDDKVIMDGRTIFEDEFDLIGKVLERL